MKTNRYPHLYGTYTSPAYRKAHEALAELQYEDPQAAEVCCLKVLAPLWQSRYSAKHDVSPRYGHIARLINSARRQGFDVPKRPYHGNHEDPPWCDHPTVWYRENKPIFFTSESYAHSSGILREIDEYCETRGLDYDIDPTSLWYPGSTQMVRYFVPGLN